MQKDYIKNLFLSDSYHEQLKEYKSILSNDSKCNWDVVVITASNEKQANLYEIQIAKRLKYNLLPKNCDYIVIPDKDNKRIGSGGATLNVLLELEKKYKNIDDLKILLIHSGGDSKRIPQYSATGKLFSPVPRELTIGFSSTLFDELLILFCMVPLRMDTGMLTICGDALLLFNPLQLDLQYKDLASISMKAPIEEGTIHGVMVEDKNGLIEKFLHKCPAEKLKQEGAVINNQVNIDTGIVYFSTKLLHKFIELTKKNERIFISEKTRLNLYGDILYPFANASTLENYLKEAAEIEINDNILKSRKALWELKSDFDYSLIKLSPSRFIHFGTTIELYELMVNNIEKYKTIGWSRIDNSSFYDGKVCVINSKIKNSKIKGAFIENSVIENSTIGENVVISNTIIKNVDIPNNVCLSTLKVKNGYVTRIYDIRDNPKESISKPFLTNNMGESINKYKLNLNIDQSLWEAELFPVGKTKKESVDLALILYRILNKTASNNEVALWKTKPKESFFSSFNNAIFEDDKSLIVNIIFDKIIEFIENKQDLNKLCNYLNNSIYIKDIIKKLKDNVNKVNLFCKIRIYYILSIIDTKNSDINYSNIFSSIKELVTNNYKKQNNNYTVKKDKVEVYLPIRLNFGGGWSDTPPYCIENGGKVLNVATKLNGQLPIHVIVERIKDKKIMLESYDLGKSSDFFDSKSIYDCSNPNDSFALVKSAIVISELVDEHDNNLDEMFKKVSGGVKIITDVRQIPRGSGLGTSSILSGALMKALYEFMGINKTNQDISDDVLRLEQLMSTGGGWQDQVGGIFPGLKLITSKPSIPQKLTINTIEMSKKFKKEFNDRIVLINTGQRRLARNLLREIVSKYVSNDNLTLNVLSKIQKIAVQQTNCLKNEDIKGFGLLLDEHWELIKQMDPGSTNLCIETIIKVISDDVYGKALCGAGGGGFIVAVLKEGVTKKQIEKKLLDIFADTEVKLYEVEVYEE